MQMCARRSDVGLKEGKEEAAREGKPREEESPLFRVLPFDFIVARIPLQSKFRRYLLYSVVPRLISLMGGMECCFGKSFRYSAHKSDCRRG